MKRLQTVLVIVVSGAVAVAVVAYRSRSAREAQVPDAPASVAIAGPDSPRLVALTGHDDMTFSMTTIQAAPGELLTVSLQTVSRQPAEIMHHNFVLLSPEITPVAFALQAVQTHGHGQHVPQTLESKVIASTDVAGAGQSVAATFRAPTTPGEYVYLCSVPGHFGSGMKGVLIVRERAVTAATSG